MFWSIALKLHEWKWKLQENTLPKLHFSDTEKFMDDLSLMQIVQASRFNTYSSDGYDSMEAERDICIYSEEYFKHTSTSFLQGLRYTPTENISDWITRKKNYKPAIAIPKLLRSFWKKRSSLISTSCLHWTQ